MALGFIFVDVRSSLGCYRDTNYIRAQLAEFIVFVDTRRQVCLTPYNLSTECVNFIAILTLCAKGKCGCCASILAASAHERDCVLCGEWGSRGCRHVHPEIVGRCWCCCCRR